MSAKHSTNTRQELLARIMGQVRVDDASKCWMWLGTQSTCRMKYGQMSINNKAVRVHRVMYELKVGPIPIGKFVCHKCDTPLCCNPDHLFLGTHQDNMDDRQKKGRVATGLRNGRYTKPESVCKGQRNGRAKLTARDVGEIRCRYKAGGVLLKDLASEFHVSISAVWSIVTHQNWA